MSSTSNFTLPQDLTFQEVFHVLKEKFGFPLPPEEMSLAALGQEKFNFFAQSKFLLTYARRNFAAAVREFEAFANLDNLAEETLSKASGIQSTKRRQAAIQKRRIQAFNQELEKQLRLFNRDGGSIATQGNQRNSILSAGRRTVTERSNSLLKTSDEARQKVLQWRLNNMAARSGESSNPTSRLGLRTRESFDNEINDAFPSFYEEPTEIDIETDESGMIPVDSFRAEALPGVLPEVGFEDAPSRNILKAQEQPPTAPPSSKPLDSPVHSPPAKPVKSENWNWGTYKPPPGTLTSRPNFTQDRRNPMKVQAPRPVPGASSSRGPIRQESWTENQVPNSFKTSKAPYSFETDTTEESTPDSMLRSRNEYQGTQPTSFNTSSSSTGSTNGSRPVMRGGSGNRPASPSTQLHCEEEQASSKGSYSVGGSTIEELRMLGLPKSRRQSPPAGRSVYHAPLQNRPTSVPPNGGSPQCHESAPESAGTAAQSRNNLSRSVSSKNCKLHFYQTLEKEQFPGDNYKEMFSELKTPFWLQWETERMILATSARNTEANKVPTRLHNLLTAFADEPDMGYEAAQDRFKEFWTQFNEEEKYRIPNLKRDSYAAILRSENGWDNRIQLSAELVLDRDTDPNKASSEVFRPTLRPRALNLRPTSTRFDRRFGSHRFMSLRVLKVGPITKALNSDIYYDALARYLSQEGFEYLGRRWRAICHRSSTKDESGKRISLAKQDKNLQVIVIMFAEEGPGIETIDQRSAVEWLLPINQNLESQQCKLYARIALGFSTTTPSVVFEKNEIDYTIRDIEVHGLKPDRGGKLPKYSLTDGCGLASPAVFRAVARQLGLPYPPSAVQARIGAAKGLWIMDPSIPLDSEEMQIRIRPDQNKFKGISLAPEHRTLDICNTSKPLKVSALNLQFIVILLHNGVSEATLEELLREDIRNEVTELFKDGRLDDGASLRKYLERVKLKGSRYDGKATAMKGRVPLSLAERAVDLINAGFTLQNLTLKMWFQTVLVSHCESIKDKMRIRIAQSCQPYCVPDPSGKLKKGQVYLRFGPESKFIDPKTMMAMDILRGDVLVGRNPAHFASDVQKVTAVDIPELRYLTDVIVFPADPESNDRSLADYLSGGDYDGDRVWTCWDQRLVREFKGELIHGPSTINIDQYFVPDRKMVWDDFGMENESPNAFSTFIQHHLRAAMNEELLGQCTSLFEKFVYKEYNDKRGVLNLEVAKQLGAACGKLVDAPKQGVQLKPGYWENWKKTHGSPWLPFYKMSEKELRRRQLFDRAKTSRHPIDRLKFQVAEDEVSSLIALFEESFKDASSRDEDLLIYSRKFFSRCDTDMESQDPFLKGAAEELLRQRNHLNRELDSLKKKWGAYWTGRDFEWGDEKDSETSGTLVEECVRMFDDILPLPCEDKNPIGMTLVAQWKLGERDPFSEWNRVKTSLLHERMSSWKDYHPAIPWFIAGDMMCFEKWRVTSEEFGRRSGFVTQPISSASRIKALALKKSVEDREWLSGGPGGEDDNQDDSDDEFSNFDD
ncbi:uncharacterized protein DFL_008417 [Arthrobotrys flagrans]|uniref:RDRP core domain-containing protein n=1 Tax=Arthrobotrys flagrans TaxID=97331 RepID=A0A436ZNP6_ARTFL|nr:hypothetical protein DFL_008417 [Arthrobotrys flagrans]